MVMSPNCVIRGVAFWLSFARDITMELPPSKPTPYNSPGIAPNEVAKVSANEVITTINLIIN